MAVQVSAQGQANAGQVGGITIGALGGATSPIGVSTGLFLVLVAVVVLIAMSMR